MATLTIRNLSDQAHDALRRRAAENRRSMEAEARSLLEALNDNPPPPLDQDRLKRLQARAIKAFGGEEAKAGEVDRFIAERSRLWGE